MLVAHPNFESLVLLIQEPAAQGTGDGAPPPVRRSDMPMPGSTLADQTDKDAGPAAATSDFGFLPMLLGFVAIFYLLILRPTQKQEKKRKELLGSVKKGDHVATSGGMHGVISALTDTTITLRVAPDVQLVFDRAAISRVLAANETPATAITVEGS